LAVIRELITVLGASVDKTGFQQYETGIARIKELALGLGKLFGLAFSVDKIVEFAEGLIDAGKEVNKLTAQLKLIARPMDDISETTKGVYELSQRLGVSYVHMLETYKEFANEVRDTKIPTEDLLAAVENIQKGFEVARATPEQQTQVMEALQRGFRSGKMRPVSVGLMKDILPPEAFNMLLREFNLGVGDAGEAALREMAKKGEISAERVVEAFKKANVTLDKQFDAVPQKIGRVFTRIYNDLVVVTAQIYKLTDASVFMGQMVWYVWTRFRAAVIAVTESVGGLKNLIQLLGIAVMVAMGPMVIRNLTSIVALTIRWGIANALLLAQWVAMGAAVLGIALAISDLVFWIQGKRSVIGTWVGPFKDLAANFKNLDIFSGMRGFSDLIRGDFEGFLKEWKIFVKNVPAEVLTVTTAIALIGTAFTLLTPIVSLVLNGIIRALGAVKVAAAETAASVKAAETAAAVPGVKGLGVAAAVPAAIGVVAGGQAIATAASDPGAWYQRWKDYLNNGRSPWSEQKKREKFNLLDLIPDRIRYGPESIRNENVAPGALGPRVPGATNVQNNPTLNQTNNIHVETTLDAAQIGQIIGEKVTTAGEQMINGLTRGLQRAGPRVENATQ
jgi:hypothetical protein